MEKICWKGKAFKALSYGKGASPAGRNFSGSITIFHRGGGSKKLLRRIDFKRKHLARGLIERIEYDPNRTARIALVRWSNFNLNGCKQTHNRNETSFSESRRLKLKRLLWDELEKKPQSKHDCSSIREISSVKGSIASNPEDSVQTAFSYILACNDFKPGDEVLNIDPQYKPQAQRASVLQMRPGATLEHTDDIGPAKLGATLEQNPSVDPSERATLQRATKGASSLNESASLLEKNPRLTNADSESFGRKTNDPQDVTTDGSTGDKLQEFGTDFSQIYSLEQLYEKSGISLPLSLAPIGSLIHNIELYPGEGGKLVRAAGASAQLVQKPLTSTVTPGLLAYAQARFAPRGVNRGRDEGLCSFAVAQPWASQRGATKGAQPILAKLKPSGAQPGTKEMCTIRLPSGQQLLVDLRCRATIGVVSNIDHGTRALTKAGQRRWRGFRPVVRGVAMNPIDHPHGGGEGRTKGGRPSVSPWGKPTKGHRSNPNGKGRASVSQRR